jgi:acetyl esterase/lipase
MAEMPSEQMQQYTSLLRAQREAGAGTQLTAPEARAAFAEILSALPEIPGGRIEIADAGGVPAEWVHPANGSEPAGTLLYLHGGGYYQGSPATHRRLVTALIEAAGIRALSLDYRLAPENPFPAAVEDAVTAYRWLTRPAGEAPSQVIVAGDSAGGGLASALLVALRNAGDALPAGAYLMSPWTDLAGTGQSLRTRADVEPMLDPGSVVATARLYRPEGDLTDPLVSPLYADLAALPPLLVHVGDSEILLDDARRLVQRARAAGVPAELEEWPDAFHVFQMLVGLIPEADEAVARAGAWMAKRLAAAD